MVRIFLLLFFLNAIALSAQEEKRLALVIGNADYELGELKNPVNDAILMSEAFDSLGFDVILDTNIRTKYEFEKVIREFDSRRENYDVGFVYYAGHGIQVGSENFMIPTNEKLEQEEDVYYSGINVQMIIRILTRSTDQVNVLILDACRNNPFEQRWNRNRSLNKGNGLAKMQAPMGSLIAFATTAGNTAPDGDGENSIYCSALWNNMFKERVSLDQFFRNVRSEVLTKTNGQQQTEESTQLTGETFYLVQSNFRFKYLAIDSLIIGENYFEALDLTQEVLFESIEKEAILRKAEIYNLLEEYDKEIEHLDKYQLLFPDWIELLEIRGATYEDLEDYSKAKQVYKKIIQLDSSHSEAQLNLAICHEYLNALDSAIVAYSKAIELDSTKTEYLSYRSDSYLLRGDTLKALEDLNRALQISDTTWTAYTRIAELYEAINEMDKAYETYQKIITLGNTPVFELSHALNNQALLLEELQRPEDAVKNLLYIRDNFTDKLADDLVAKVNRNLGDLYFNKLNQPKKAIESYKESIYLDSWEGTYKKLIDVHLFTGDTIEALSVSDELLKQSRNPFNLSDKADILFFYGAYSKAVRLYEESNSSAVDSIDYSILINWNADKIAQCYWYIDKTKKAISYIEETLNDRTALQDSVGIAQLYKTKSVLLSEEGKINEASLSLQSALKFDKTTDLYVYMEYFYWENNDTIGVRSARRNGLNVAKDISDTLELLEAALLAEIEWKEWIIAEELANLMIQISMKPEFYSYAGKIALNNQKYDDAIKHLNAAIELDSLHIDAYFLRSKVWRAMNDDIKSLDDLHMTIRINEEDPEGYYYSALFYSSKNEFLKALKYLGLTISRYTNEYYISNEDGSETVELSTVYIQRAEVYSLLGDNDLMCEDLLKAQELGAKINLDLCSFKD